jgi:GNAT superfamily N-acetyltransferase
MALLFSKTRRLPADPGRGPNDVDTALGTKVAEPQVAKVVIDALVFMAAALTDEQLEMRDPDRIAALLPWAEFSQRMGAVAAPIQTVIKKSALVEQDKFKMQKADIALDAPPITAIDITPSLNLIDQAAVAYAQTQAGKLIVQISEKLRGSIRTVVTSAMAGEISTYDVAKILRESIPLHSAWAQAVTNTYDSTLRDALKDETTTMAQARVLAQKASATQAKSLTNARAWNIARTEVQTAANQGRYAGWEDGVNAGYIRPTSLKIWQEGRSPCPICAPLVGEIQPWDKPFSDGSLMPPEHPSCRCSASLLPPDEKYLAQMADQTAARDAASFVGDAHVAEDLTLGSDGLLPDVSSLDTATADVRAVEDSLPRGNIIIPDTTPDLAPHTAEQMFSADLEKIKAAVNSVYDGQTFGNFHVELRGVQHTDYSADKIHILQDIYKGAAKKEVGFIQSTLTAEADGTYTAKIDEVLLNKASRGKGFNSAFQDFTEKWYRDLGISRIDVLASRENGAYAWAKAGYDWADTYGTLDTHPTTVIYDLNYVASELDKIPSADNSAAAAQLRAFKDALEGPRAGWPSPAEIANYNPPYQVAGKVEGEPLGKFLLTNSDWNGQKLLTLDTPTAALPKGNIIIPGSPPEWESPLARATLADPAAVQAAVDDGDWRYIADPTERADFLFQFSHDNLSIIRPAAQNVIDGKSALDGIDTGWFRSSWDKPFSAELADGSTKVMQLTGAEIDDMLASAAKNLADRLLAPVEKTTPLFRGMIVDDTPAAVEAMFAKGTVVPLGTGASFASSATLASKFSLSALDGGYGSLEGDGVRVSMALIGSAPVTPLAAPWSTLDEIGLQESLVRGDVKVVSAKWAPAPDGPKGEQMLVVLVSYV